MYINVFANSFLGLSQGRQNGRCVQRILLHTIDDVICPLDANNGPQKELVSLKKIQQGDYLNGTIKTMLRWIIDTVNMMIYLPQHQLQRLADIIASIPIMQKQMSVRKWHKVVGELRSMALALPGARHLLSPMQHALTNKLGTRVLLQKGVHHALKDF